MRKKQSFSILSPILLTVLFLIVAFVSSRSTAPDDPGHAAGLPEREAFFDTNALADFFDENRELFEDTLELVKDNPKMFCIDTWGGEAELLSGNGGAKCKEDIVHYDKLLSEMERLSMTRIDYYNQDPIQVIFYFSSTSSAWSLYVIYGQDIPTIDKAFSLDEYVDLGDSWLVYGDFHG